MTSGASGSMGRTDYLWARRGPLTGSATRRILTLATLVAAFALAPLAAAQQTPSAPLTTRLAKALAVPHVNHARSSAIAVDLTTGNIVFARNAHLSLAPASTEKLALSYALLVELGPAYRIETRVVGEGDLEGSNWRGDVFLKGAGDPSLSFADIRRLAAQVRRAGVRRISGSIVGDESFFDSRRVAPGWKASYYLDESPPLSALTVDRGRFGGGVSRQPAQTAAQLLRSALVSAGVAVAGHPVVGRTTSDVQLAAVASQPVLHLLKAVNRESDNFTAEILLKHLGAVRLGQGTTAAGAAVVRHVLASDGVSLAGLRFVDGSGLSLLNRTTAHALVDILVAAWNDPLLRGSFLASLAVAGQNGTLARRLTKAPVRGQIFAKTGTTSLASTLAGYAAARYAFAVLHNGPPLSSWWARHAQDRFVSVLARQ
jgi:D-alanyl-D-alanine carboxypeptidase/D-alanyl-D-alanine-endopeptidase (penicillin-binding protein 4)